MEKMRSALKEDDPDLLVYGCSSHMLNLLGGDITPASISKHVAEIQKYFRNHHKPCAWLTETSGSAKPQLPNDTCWKSQLTCFDTFIKNRPACMSIMLQHEEEYKWDVAIKKRVMDVNLFRNVKDLCQQLRPVAVALDACQSNSTSIADACHVWLRLLSEPALEPHKEAVESRFSKVIQTEHLVAYCLHPTYQGSELTPKQQETVANWIIAKDPSYLAPLMAFQARESPFLPAFFNDTTLSIPPVTWWKSTASRGVPQDFINMVTQLFRSPPSSAAIERVFSSFGLIHTKLRNRLGNTTVSKLVFCYRVLRGNFELDY
jgi:hypothetical protein